MAGDVDTARPRTPGGARGRGPAGGGQGRAGPLVVGGWTGGVPNPPRPGPASPPLRGSHAPTPGSQMQGQGRGTHLRHISPVSVMLGCQILVKHFTLGGCNAEREGGRSVPGSPDRVCIQSSSRPIEPLVPRLTQHSGALGSGSRHPHRTVLSPCTPKCQPHWKSPPHP